VLLDGIDRAYQAGGPTCPFCHRDCVRESFMWCAEYQASKEAEDV
jgi:hypothetical protein